MSALAFTLRYAVRSLRRSGQRGALAVVCVAFGVFSLVAMQLLAGSVRGAVLLPPDVRLGGDLALDRGGEPLAPADLATLATDPDVEAVEARADLGARFVQSARDGRIVIAIRTEAVDPRAYPLVGHARVRDRTLADALARPGTAVLSSDLADALGVGVGGGVRLAGTPGGTPLALTVGGVADRLPDALGGTVLVSRATAARLVGSDRPTSAYVRSRAPEAVAARFERAGWTATRPAPVADEVERVFGLALPAAGLLGLLVGGVGIANTLHVLLARRRTEIAVLKTLGYRRRDLVALFGTETALLGLAGGASGVALGVAGAEGLRRVVASGLSYLLAPHLAPSVLVGGLLAGVATSVIFGLVPVLRASGVRPAALLRQTPVRASGRTRAATLGLWAALLALFGALGSVLVGSVAGGFGAVAVGVAGLAGLGAVMVAALALVARAPTPGLPLATMALRNLRRHPARSAASLVALFVGAFTFAVAAHAILNASDEVTSRTLAPGRATVAVYGVPAADADLRRIAAGAPVWVDRSAPADVTTADGADLGLGRVHGRGADAASSVDVLDGGRSGPGGAWLDGPAGVLLPARLSEGEAPLAIGDSVVVRAGAARTLVVQGFYEPPGGVPLVPSFGAVVLPETFRALGASDVAETVAIEADPDRAETLAAAVGRAHPDGAVITAASVADSLVRLVRGLFRLVGALSGLALAAGAVLVANGVGLALVERRREIGVLKAVGYSSAQVLRVLTVESALLGVIGGGLGAAAGALALKAVGAQGGAVVTTDPAVTVGLVVATTAVAVLVTLAVAWGAAGARPLDALRSD